MRRAGGLYPKIAEPENLELAFWKAQRGKSARSDVREFRADLSANLRALREELLRGSVSVGNYRYFTIHDPKERVICAADFRERVLHHAIVNVCEPVFEKYQIFDSFACRKGKGLDACLARTREFCRKYRWFLKMDVHKFFDSVEHATLLRLLARRFKDEGILDLFSKIVLSYETSPGRGLPIGNLTSQYFANLYLGALDHQVKDVWRVPAYVRYMDDFVLFFDEKKQETCARAEVEEFLSRELKLSLNPPQINRTACGLPFLSYRVFGKGLRLSQKARRRFCRKIAEANREESAERALPLLAFVCRADSCGFRKKIFNGTASSRHEPRESRRQLEQQRGQLRVVEQQQQFAGQPQRQSRFSHRFALQLRETRGGCRAH